jgi:hypothetical protein
MKGNEELKKKDEELEKLRKENKGLKKQLSSSSASTLPIITEKDLKIKPIAKISEDELSLFFILLSIINNNQFQMLPLVVNTQKMITNTLINLLLINFS